MNSSPHRALGHLLLLPKTDRWSSAILNQVNQDQIVVRTFETQQSLCQDLRLYPNRVVVVELTETLDSIGLKLLWKLSRRLGFPLIAAGDFATEQARIPLIQAGFAETFSSTAEVERLLKLSVDFLKKQTVASLTIEQQVARDLPWTPTDK